MTYNPETAAIRFGTGLSPDIAAPKNLTKMLARLGGPDKMAKRFPIDSFAKIEKFDLEYFRLNRVLRKEPDRAEETRNQLKAMRKQARSWQADWLRATIARQVFTDDGLRERLVLFWADHFTVVGKKATTRFAVSTYVEDVIRPHITGKFSKLLKVAIFHPMMLLYLDQINSVGPNSAIARRKPGRGINENLAREVLELHTMGVEGSYSQDDIKELAKLFAGLTYKRKRGFTYAKNMAEPGPETVLGNSYGKNRQNLAQIADFLDDLALHPDTVRHLAKKLVVHFVSDNPDADLVEQVAAAYTNSGGDLMACYKALLNHPAAWSMPAMKVKQPFGYITSALRALGVTEKAITSVEQKKLRTMVVAPMLLMGQPWQNPNGPDGWAEAAEHWITPQGLAARIQWAMAMSAVLHKSLPDPGIFIDTTLGSRASEGLRLAVNRAETKTEAVGLVLASPEFQRN